jgi:Tfp pilus assembly protein PilN
VTFLTQINDIVPPDAWLTSVDATTPEVFELKGAASTQQSGLTLARAISEFREVDTVKVLDLKRTAPDRYEFTIDVTLSKTAQPAGPEPTAAGTPPPAGAPPAGPSASEKGQAVMQRFNSTNPEGQKK